MPSHGLPVHPPYQLRTLYTRKIRTRLQEFASARSNELTQFEKKINKQMKKWNKISRLLKQTKRICITISISDTIQRNTNQQIWRTKSSFKTRFFGGEAFLPLPLRGFLFFSFLSLFFISNGADISFGFMITS